jgi:VanZ family protein
MTADLLRRALFSRPARRRWMRAFLVLTPIVLALALWPKEAPATLSGWDKADHAAAFATLAMCGYFARRTVQGVVWKLALALMALGAAIEVAQLWVPGRSASVRDLLADAAGVALGLALAAGAARRLDRRRTPRVEGG